MSYSLVNLWELSNYTLFDNIVLPDDMDKTVLVNTIFDEAAELEPITPNPVLFQAKIENFFSRNLNAFTRLFDSLVADYDPLENYRRNETETAESKLAAFDSNDYQNSNYNTVGSTIYGNIGTMTSQQMLESEIKLRAKYNAYMIITDLFINDLMIQLY